MPDSVAMTDISRTTFNVADLELNDRYKLTTGLVTPRPIGWIGTYGPDGVANLAPYSFFQAVGVNPPVLIFSAVIAGGQVKDSLANVRTSGVFTANIVTHSLTAAMNETAASVDSSVSEFGLAGLTAQQFGSVDAPGVAEASAVLECRVIDEKPLGEPPMESAVVFGEVVAFHVADAVLDGTCIDTEALDSVGRLAGTEYSTTKDRFSLERPA